MLANSWSANYPVGMTRNLHHAKAPDWQDIPEEERNPFQRIAARTKGIVTVGNGFTALGTGLVLWGLSDIKKGSTGVGSAKITLGRLCDLADGEGAERTGTKSPLGAALDVAADYVQLGAALPVLVDRDIIPKRTAVVMGGQKVVNAVATVISLMEGKETLTSGSGKSSTFAQWATLGGHAVTFMLEQAGNEGAAEHVQLATNVVELAATVDGIRASAGYVARAYEPLPISG